MLCDYTCYQTCTLWQFYVQTCMGDHFYLQNGMIQNYSNNDNTEVVFGLCYYYPGTGEHWSEVTETQELGS